MDPTTDEVVGRMQTAVKHGEVPGLIATSFSPTTWELVAVSVPTVLVGLWAFWDAWRPPRCRLSARVAIGVSLAALIQWTTFLILRASGYWDATTYERVVAPYRLLTLSPLGGWGIWFTMHWFARRKTRRLATLGEVGNADRGDRLSW